MQGKSTKNGGIFGWRNQQKEKAKPGDRQGGPTTTMTPPPVNLVNNPFRHQPPALSGHSDIVFSVAFSRSDQLLASGSKDETIRLWNAESGASVATLKDGSGPIYSIAFSPDSSLLASTSGTNAIKLWDVGTGKEIAALKEHSSGVTSVAFSPDGARLVSGSHDRTIRLWDVRSRTSISTVIGHSEAVQSVAFSPDGKKIASGSSDNTAQLWETVSQKSAAVLHGHSGYVMSIAFSPNAKYLASGSWDRTVRLWNVDTGAHIVTMEKHSDNVRSVAFSPNGKYLASAAHDTTIQLWDVASKSHISTLRGHTDCARCLSFSPTGTYLASGSWDQTIRIWKNSSEEPRDPQHGTASLQGSTAVGYGGFGDPFLTQDTIKSQDVITPVSILVPPNHDITGSVSLQGTTAVGYGGFGDLFLGVHNGHGKVAMKKPRRVLDEALVRRFLREINLWCSVSHPHVLPCLGMCKIGLDVYVVSPFIENGDLLSCMARGMDLNRSKLLFEVAEALTHLHHRGIVHGDVKAQNILLGDDGSALLCDFGMAKAFDTMVTSTESKGAGSLRWMPPELFLGEGRSMASDVYSLGITIAEVLSGRAPYYDILENVAVMFHIVSRDGRPPKEPSHSPKGQSYGTLWATAEKCWVKDPKDRPYMAQVLAMLFPLTREMA